MTRSLSPSRLNNFLGCRHQSALWLDGIKPDAAVDPTLELVRERGFEHEAVVLKRLEAAHGSAVSIPTEGALEERAKATLAALKSGASLVYQGVLIEGDWLGLPDFLIRRTALNGLTVYIPEDAKLARKPKPEHLLQLGVYAELLERVLGQAPSDGVIHVAGSDPVTFDLRRTRFILKRLMRRFEDFAASTQRQSRALPCAACGQCDYKARCDREWREADSPYYVAGLTSDQIVKLEQAGVTTLAGLAGMADGTPVQGIGDLTLLKLRAQARLQHAAREQGQLGVEVLPVEAGRGFTLLPPPSAGDLYFDIEGDPLHEGGLEYLFGLWGPVQPGGEPHFAPLWAHDHAAEKAAFERLMRIFADQLARHPEAHIYHYAPYEPTALKRLAMRYATMEAELDQMLRDHRFVDLYRVARQGLIASTEGYSLKDLEKIYWGGREGAVVNAAASIVEYERWRVTPGEGILEAIASYNRDDCVSTAKMHVWLEGLRPAGGAYQPARDRADEKPDKTAERAALEQQKQQLAARVRASASGDAAVRDVVAELLWFHQRAQKPGWWSVFERQTWSDDELVDDAESLGALELDPSVAPQVEKLSLLRTFRFPPQDTKLKVGETPKVSNPLTYAGTIVDLAAEEGRIVLKRGAKAGEYPDRFGLLAAPLDQQQLPVAVMDFAERFAKGSLAGDTALMDFLTRSPPRIRARAGGQPVLDSGEDLLSGTIRAVSDLDGGYLFVQGPPGTGKTFTIAAVILDLLRQGRRVGVASNSHRAINKVLEEIEKRAKAEGRSFRGAKKGSKDDLDTHFDSDHIVSVFKSEEVSRAHQLVGGTAFHFCRGDQQGQFDYLVIDEAGQVSLGNLVAMAGSARNLVLVGDQMQLAQPIQGVHPGETGLSALDYLLRGAATVSPERGILLNESRRMRPEICDFISSAFYDGRLTSHRDTLAREVVVDPGDHPAIRSAGIVWLPVAHAGRTQSNPAEADVIADLIQSLQKKQVRRANGAVTALTAKDILVVAPYNLQVNLLKQRLPKDIAVGTIDKFQGQEAAVVILSMTTSRGEDAPRGTDFLFNGNRFNVAISRAQCLAIVVHGMDLLEGSWRGLDDLVRLNAFAQAEAIATRVGK
jgi:uncharacterized protein